MVKYWGKIPVWLEKPAVIPGVLAFDASHVRSEGRPSRTPVLQVLKEPQNPDAATAFGVFPVLGFAPT